MADSFTPNVDSQITPAYTPEQEQMLSGEGGDQKEVAQNPHAEQDQADLILGKFKTQEDLVAAYQSLEQKLGSPESPQPTTGVDQLLDAAGDYYDENGAISDEHYAQFEANGISREVVDRYIAGMQATADAETAQLMGTIGGEENFTQMSAWMTENLPESEVAAYNNVVENGSNEEVAVLLQGMFARYKAATGSGATQVQGTVSSAPAGFRSRAEVMAAMSSRRYANDSAFRDDVQRKLAVTPSSVW